MGRKSTWIVLTAVLWLFVAGVVQAVVLFPLQEFLWITTEVYSPWLPTIAELAEIVAIAFATCLLIKTLRASLGAPRECWLGVVAALSLILVPLLVGVALFAFGARWGWLEWLLATDSETGLLPLQVQLQDLWMAVLFVSPQGYGAWRGSRVDVAPPPETQPRV